MVVIFECVSERHEFKQGFSADFSGIFYGARSIFQSYIESSLKIFLLVEPIFSMRGYGVPSEDIAIDFFEFFCSGSIFAEFFFKHKCGAQNEV